MSRIKSKFIKFGAGADDVNAQKLPATNTATHYTPTAVSGESTSNVSAHLNGINAALGSISGGSGETTATYTIANNTVAATDITGLVFSSSTEKGVAIRFNVYRSTTTNMAVATGSINLYYNPIAADWYSTEEGDGNCGVTFAVTAAGQITYTSTNLSGSSYSGTLKVAYTKF